MIRMSKNVFENTHLFSNNTGRNVFLVNGVNYCSRSTLFNVRSRDYGKQSLYMYPKCREAFVDKIQPSSHSLK
jgi:hypothetical protein